MRLLTRSGRPNPLAEVQAKHPPFFEAIVADAALALRYLSRRSEFHSRSDAIVQMLKLAWDTDSFVGLVLYRAKAQLQARRIPILPRIAHRLAMSLTQICIGDPVVVHPGVYIAHGQVVVDGFVEVHSGVVLFPWVTLGLQAGVVQGPTIETDVHIGTGAKVIGPVTVGAGARIGANAVVLDDVPPGVTVVGVPARVVRG